MKNSKHQGENFKKTLEDEKICHAPSFVALLLKKKNDGVVKSSLQIRCNPCKNWQNILHRIRDNNPKFYLEVQETLNSQTSLNRRNNAGGFAKPDLKL